MESGLARRPTLRQLEYLLALADCRHFGEAAKRTAVTQPTLSLQLQALEDVIGAKLVERTRSRVALTPPGLLVAERAREVLLQVDDLLDAVRREQDNLGGLIRLGTAPTVGPYVLPRIVPDLHAQFPLLRVHIREDLPAILARSVSDGSLDVALIALPAQDDRLVAVEVGQERLLIGMPRRHDLARFACVPPESLVGQRFLTLGQGHRLYEDVSRLAARHGATVLFDYEGTSLDALRQMVALGMGLSVFPEHYAASEIGPDESIVLRPLKGERLMRSLGLIWRRSSVRASDYARLADLAGNALAIGDADRASHD